MSDSLFAKMPSSMSANAINSRIIGIITLLVVCRDSMIVNATIIMDTPILEYVLL